MIKILDRYIIKELFDPFLFGLGAFTAILSASMILFDLVRAVVVRGMPLIAAVQIFIYRLPGTAVYIFPMATLLAALLAFGKLSSQSEIVAFKAGGISLYRIMIPVLTFGFIVSVVTLLCYEVVVPRANLAATDLMMEMQARKSPKIQQNVLIPEVENDVLKRMYFAGSLRGDLMEDVVVEEFADGKLSQIINAKEARWEKEKNTWLFKNGIIYLLSDTGEYKHLIRFKEQYMTIKYSPADFYMGDRKPEEMNMVELNKFIKLKKKMGESTVDLQIQYFLKGAIPFSCLVFVLLGAPLGLSPQRSSSSIGLGISVLIVFFYYFVTFAAMAVGELGLIPPIASAWLPNIVTGGVGVYILRKSVQ
jgi:lipopolysaccharide export system permease protein